MNRRPTGIDVMLHHLAMQPLIDVVVLGCKLASEKRPDWWRWATWLAGGITIHRIRGLPLTVPPMHG